jgi:hypothetical protein
VFWPSGAQEPEHCAEQLDEEGWQQEQLQLCKLHEQSQLEHPQEHLDDELLELLDDDGEPVLE